MQQGETLEFFAKKIMYLSQSKLENISFAESKLSLCAPLRRKSRLHKRSSFYSFENETFQGSLRNIYFKLDQKEKRSTPDLPEPWWDFRSTVRLTAKLGFNLGVT